MKLQRIFCFAQASQLLVQTKVGIPIFGPDDLAKLVSGSSNFLKSELHASQRVFFLDRC